MNCPLDSFLIGKCRKYPYMVKEFIRFLLIHEVYEKYIFNYANASSYWKYTYHIAVGNPDEFIMSAFLWNATPEGDPFWNRINDLWKKTERKIINEFV